MPQQRQRTVQENTDYALAEDAKKRAKAAADAKKAAVLKAAADAKAAAAAEAAKQPSPGLGGAFLDLFRKKKK